MFGICSAGVAEGADYLDVKLLAPFNGIEYEHATHSGLGLSLGLSYFELDKWEFLLVCGGVKKYFKSQPDGFYVAGYPGVWHFRSRSVFKGSATFFAFIGTFGWRGVSGHFTSGVELGGAIMSINQIKTSAGIDPLTGYESTGTSDVGLDIHVGNAGFLPCLQLFLGYAF
jgi:hypothetical protein